MLSLIIGNLKMLRVAIAQINTTVGDLEGNTKKIINYIKKAKRNGADLVAFPELTVTGYPPQDLLHEIAFVKENKRLVKKIAENSQNIVVVVGFVDYDNKGNLYNAAALIEGNKLAGVVYKTLLPTYDVFDEDRYFKPMKEKDISQAAEIHRKVIRKEPDLDINYDIEHLFESFIKKSPKTCLVAEIENKVAGFIIGGIKEWGFGVERSGWIEMIEVNPKNMGGGIGKALGEDLIKHFKEEGIKEVYTSVKWDSGDLIAFFKSIGFEKSSFINLEYKSR